MAHRAIGSPTVTSNGQPGLSDGDGHPEGVLEFGSYRFNPTGVKARLNMPELLDIRADKITASRLQGQGLQTLHRPVGL